MTTSASGNLLGPSVEPSTAKFPPLNPIQGRHVTLKPRDLSHLDGLYEVLGGEKNVRLWDYIHNGPFTNREEFCRVLQERIEIPDTQVYTIMSNATQNP